MPHADDIRTQADNHVLSCISAIDTATAKLKELHSLFADDEERLEAAQKYVDQINDSLPDDCEPTDFDAESFADAIDDACNDIAHQLLNEACGELKETTNEAYDNATDALLEQCAWANFAEDPADAIVTEAASQAADREAREHDEKMAREEIEEISGDWTDLD